MMLQLRKTVWQCLKTLNRELPLRPGNSTLKHIPKNTEKQQFIKKKKKLHMNVHSIIIHNSPKVEQPKSINWRMNKQNVVQPYNGYYSTIKNEWNIDKCLEKEMATHSSILAWKIPWTEDPGRLQFMGLQRVGHNSVTEHTDKCYSVTEPRRHYGKRKKPEIEGQIIWDSTDTKQSYKSNAERQKKVDQ